MLTTSSFPSFKRTSTGVFHDDPTPLVRQISFPDVLLKATSDPLSTLALIINRSPYSTGEQPEPQPLVPSPTLAVQISLPSRSKQKTPDLPKNTYSRSPSVMGVLPA